MQSISNHPQLGAFRFFELYCEFIGWGIAMWRCESKLTLSSVIPWDEVERNRTLTG